MNWLVSPEMKVGLLVLIVSGIIAGMSLRVNTDPGWLGSSKEAWFYIDDASGLVRHSNVAMAGINVGIIHDIKLENGQARVEMALQGAIPLTKSARIEIRPNGILGDKHVELISGDPRDPPLSSGEQILVVDDRASVDRLISEVSRITKSLGTVAENVKSATEGDTDKPLGRIVSNVEIITRDLAELSQKRKVQVGEIIDNVHEMTDTLNDIVNDDGPDGLKTAMHDAIHSLQRIEGSIRNVEEITGKINRGEGTIGKLVNDETTVEEVNTAVSTINSYLDAANKLQTAVDFHSYYLSDGAGAKSTLSLKVQPGLDRYYELGVVSDPRGVTSKTITVTDMNGPNQTIHESKTYQNLVKFNLLFAKSFYNFTIKGGVLESTGGVAGEYEMLKKRLKLSVEAFDFTNFNLRISARYNIMTGLYVMAGGEDILSQIGNSSAFIGAGLSITNDDLKLLLARMPF